MLTWKSKNIFHFCTQRADRERDENLYKIIFIYSIECLCVCLCVKFGSKFILHFVFRPKDIFENPIGET